MGTVVNAKKLTNALEKARGVGMVEDTFTVDDCEVTLRNLRPDEYEQVVEECSELEDLEYITEFQKGHICRAIVELNGVSFREIELIECEEPDPKNPEKTRTVKRERHDWLRNEVLATWGREAIYTAYRKFTDVVALAEKKAKSGVAFLTPDETGEERYRRLLAEVRELENEVPPGLVVQILNENGLMHFTEVADRAAMDKLDEMADKKPVPEAVVSPPVLAPAPPPPATATMPASAVPDVLRRRVPLNQVDSTPPAPAVPVVVPDEVPLVASPIPGVPPSAPSNRSAAFLAAEAEYDPEIRAALNQNQAGVVRPTEIPTLSGSTEQTDPQKFAQIVERPPVVGLNPKFQPPQR